MVQEALYQSCGDSEAKHAPEEIQKNIGQILDIDPKKISIKGKTSESIGFIGREEGIAAMAITSAQIPEINFDDS